MVISSTYFNHSEGFRRTFFKKDDKNIKLKETKEIFLVTKCSASEPLQSLSVTQITGAFLGLYCGGASCVSLFMTFCMVDGCMVF